LADKVTIKIIIKVRFVFPFFGRDEKKNSVGCIEKSNKNKIKSRKRNKNES
jgi:hypothetical protein